MTSTNTIQHLSKAVRESDELGEDIAGQITTVLEQNGNKLGFVLKHRLYWSIERC